MLQSTNLFSGPFQKQFIARSVKTYNERQQKQLDNYSLTCYLDFCSSFYALENAQLDQVLGHRDTQNTLNASLDKILIQT